MSSSWPDTTNLATCLWHIYKGAKCAGLSCEQIYDDLYTNYVKGEDIAEDLLCELRALSNGSSWVDEQLAVSILRSLINEARSTWKTEGDSHSEDSLPVT